MKNHESFEDQGPGEGPDPVPETHQNLKNQPGNELLTHGETLPVERDGWKELRDLQKTSNQTYLEACRVETGTQAFLLKKLGFVSEKPEFWVILDWLEGPWCFQPDLPVSYGAPDDPKHQFSDPDGTYLVRVPELGIAYFRAGTCHLMILRLSEEVPPETRTQTRRVLRRVGIPTTGSQKFPGQSCGVGIPK